jgi:hypothetical protein
MVNPIIPLNPIKTPIKPIKIPLKTNKNPNEIPIKSH